MQKTNEIFLNKKSFAYNISFLQKELGPDILISSVVKGNAYGHGIESFVPMVESTKLITHFSVFSAFEAYRVQKCLKKKTPIMIMGYIDEHDLPWAIENEIEFFVFDFERLKLSFALAEKLNKKALIHIELETGMHRTGFDEETLNIEFFNFLKTNSNFYTLKGLCTHFAGAEDIANYVRIKRQKESFLALRERFLSRNLKPQYTHTCCSAAAIRLTDMRFNMVRIGILQYGFWPSMEIKIEYLRRNNLEKFNLKSVLSWTTKLMAIKHVKMGEFIGYGSSYQAIKDMKVGVLPVGYSNGYARALSNSGRVIINNVRTQVIGTVMMNTSIIDLSHAPHSKPGDEVILIGSKRNREISVGSFGELSNQLNYELLTRLPMDIPRRIIYK